MKYIRDLIAFLNNKRIKIYYMYLTYILILFCILLFQAGYYCTRIMYIVVIYQSLFFLAKWIYYLIRKFIKNIILLLISLSASTRNKSL